MVTTLNLLAKGQSGKIIEIHAGGGLLRHIKHLGLHEGDVVRVVQNSKGPIIVGKGQLRVALGRGMSHKIEVEKISKAK